MREAHLSDTGYELKLTLKNYESSLCNGENILDDLEERLTGARDKSESELSFDELFFAALADHNVIRTNQELSG